MSIFRITAFSIFTFLAVFCVGYANSQSPQLSVNGEIVYSSNYYFAANCLLTVRTEGGASYFTPVSSRINSHAEFIATYPTSIGDAPLTISVESTSDNSNSQTQTSETLSIEFRLVNGEIQPASYTYVNEDPLRGSLRSPVVNCDRLNRVP